MTGQQLPYDGTGNTVSIDVNRAHWDERAAAHADTELYAFDKYRNDPEYIGDIVRFDVPLLGDIRGKRGVHLQCHIGTDTISLSRLGARMTGLDFSAASLEQARRLATEANADVDFVHAAVYDAPTVLPAHEFDLVFTGIGALCWLPDIRRWADVLTELLAPGGRLFLREGHPVMWSVDERIADRIVVDFPYFEQAEPLVWDEDGSYADADAHFENTLTHSWNHGLGEIVTALLSNGLTITGLVEHQSVPWEGFPGKMTLGDDGEYRLTERPGRMPLTYTLQATAPS